MIRNKETIQGILEKYIRLIVDNVTSNIYGVDSIILYGGYGRDEGAWIKTNDSYEPYNDFDILIVVNNTIEMPTSNQIALIKKNLLDKINIQWIDLTFIKLKDFLKSKKKSIFQYDLKYGSKVIYGNNILLNQIKSFDSSEINLVEGKLLFFTRLWPFVGGANDAIDLNQTESRFFRYQMSKAILAAIDMQLLMKGAYASSYLDRCKLMVDMHKKSDMLDEDLINWALHQKLNPSNKKMKANEVNDLQIKVAQIYSYYSLKILSSFYNKNFSSLISFYYFYSKSLSEYIKIIGAKVMQKKIDYKKNYFFNNIQILILSAILEETSEEYVIAESNNYLVRLGFSKVINLNDLRQLIAIQRIE